MACVVRKAGNKISEEDIITIMENKVLILFDLRIDNQHKHQTNGTALLTIKVKEQEIKIRYSVLSTRSI